MMAMNGEKRRTEIYDMILKSGIPLTGADLAKVFNVTRQIIVKDIAILRARSGEIISTPKGYIAEKNKDKYVTRKIKVMHKQEKIEDELETIIDLGGRVLTTQIEHPFYGTIGEELGIKSRKDIKLFIKKLDETESEPLLKLTKGSHFHIIEGEDENTLNEICNELKLKGYLILD